MKRLKATADRHFMHAVIALCGCYFALGVFGAYTLVRMAL